ncbi:MAG: phage head-tail connector protein [Clostridia bacterium]|nr:phage head-tail connector protein [Clostridia bacterium]
MTAYERLKARLPDAKEDMLEALMDDAEGMILAYTGRQTLPKVLESAQVQLAVVLYNRQGIEGQTSHSEGGVSRTMEAFPEEIRRQAAPYRLARIVRVSANETA